MTDRPDPQEALCLDLDIHPDGDPCDNCRRIRAFLRVAHRQGFEEGQKAGLGEQPKCDSCGFTSGRLSDPKYTVHLCCECAG